MWLSSASLLMVIAGLAAHLEHEGGDERDQVGVAAALAEPVDRALYLARARAHGGERIGNRVVGVVVAVDAEALAGNALGRGGDDALDLVRQRAAVGVAQHDPARARLDSAASRHSSA